MRRSYESSRQLDRPLAACRGQQRFHAVHRELRRRRVPVGKGETPGQYGESRSSFMPALTVSSKSDTRSLRSFPLSLFFCCCNARQKFRIERIREVFLETIHKRERERERELRSTRQRSKVRNISGLFNPFHGTVERNFSSFIIPVFKYSAAPRIIVASDVDCTFAEFGENL